MAVINYSDQFKYAGKGYMDAKIAPVAKLNDLTSISSFLLAKYYTPGMVVMVLDDDLGKGPSHYVLDTDYTWKKLNKGIEDEIIEVQEKTNTLDTRIKEIASKVNDNTDTVETINERLEKIAGIEKLKAGDNITLNTDEEGYVVISAEVDLNAAVDDVTIKKNENGKLLVKISQLEGNSLTVKEDGIFSTGVEISGDDLENEII